MTTPRTCDALNRIRVFLEDCDDACSPLTDAQLRAAPVEVAIVSGGGGGGGSTGGLTNTELRAAPVPVSGTVSATCSGTVAISGSVAVTGPLTDTQIRATPLPVSGTVSATCSGTVAVSNFPATQPVSGTVAVSNFPATQPVSGTVNATCSGTVAVSNFPATQPVSGTVAVSNFPATQPVSGTVNATCSGTVAISGSVAVTGPLTDTQIRATPLPVSGTVNATCSGTVAISGSVAVTGPLTDTQIRATPLPVSGTVSATCSGTVAVSNFPATQVVSAAALPLPSGAAADATLTGGTQRTKITDGTNNAALAAANPAGTEQGLLVRDIPIGSPLCVTTTAASGSAATLTLPLVSGQFHYITSIRIEAYNTAARTGGATPVLVTSTNLPGSLAWTFGSAGNVGVVETKQDQPCLPMKSSVAATATTIVAPATTSVIWRITVTYYAAP